MIFVCISLAFWLLALMSGELLYSMSGALASREQPKCFPVTPSMVQSGVIIFLGSVAFAIITCVTEYYAGRGKRAAA